MKKNILLVEDENGIATMEKNYLENSNFLVDIAYDGSEALDHFEKGKYDLVILDLMIPIISGEEVLKKIREISSTPVILVTAKIQENDVLNAFKSGADDYIRKPFSGLELVERVKAVLRRVEKAITEFIVSKDGLIKFDVKNHRLILNNEEVNLTKNELLIVETLFKNPNKTFTRDEIIEIAFGYDYEAYDRAIDTHIKNIRHKIEEDPKSPKYIKTIYGLGYKAGDIDEAK